MEKKVSVENLSSEILKELKEYNLLSMKKVSSAVKKTATDVKKEIAKNAPKDTGKYSKTWRTKLTNNGASSIEYTVYSTKPSMPHLLEKGHASRNGKRVAGKKHIAPAEEHGKNTLLKLIKEGLKNE